MVTKKVEVKNKIDWLEAVKWSFIFLLVVGAIGSDFYFDKLSFVIKVVIWLVCASFGLFLFVSTSLGRDCLSRFDAALVELRKVSWPSRDEVAKTTYMVGLCILFVSVLLWCMDSFFAALVKWLSI